MTSSANTLVKRLIPVLRVDDVQKSIDYYVGKLGCLPGFRWGEPLSFASVYLGECEIFFCCQAQGQPGMWLHLEVDDVDVLHERFVAAGARIRQPPINLPWGRREMNVEDLDSHRLRFSSPATDAPEGDLLEQE